LGPLVPVKACCSGTSKLSFQVTCEKLPLALSWIWVPPTAVTSGSVAGQPVTGVD